MIRRAIVVGLGYTGLSCVPYLRGTGYDVVVCDSRTDPPLAAALAALDATVPLYAGPFSPRLLAEADLLVISPGVSMKDPAIRSAVANNVPIVGDIELFARVCAAPIIAITGANGKSTVTSLVGEMLRACGRTVEVAGNIGVPVLSLLDRSAPDFYVLELSSFQLETTSSLNAQAATVLNISPDHMDRYTDLDEYAHAKVRVFAGSGRMVINRDDAWVAAMARSGRDVVTFGLDRPIGHDLGIVHNGSDTWLMQGKQPLMPAADVPLPGLHNVANVLAAFALATAVSRDTAAMAAAVRRFRGLAHRTTVVGVAHGVTWIDDSKGTNVGATMAAMAGLPGPIVLIAGGEGKGADFRALRAVVGTKARAVIVIGRDGPQIAAALAGCCPVVAAADLPSAVAQARTLAQEGDSVLLSPACASFDMFRDYAHRGEVFADAVQKLVLMPSEREHG